MKGISSPEAGQRLKGYPEETIWVLKPTEILYKHSSIPPVASRTDVFSVTSFPVSRTPSLAHLLLIDLATIIADHTSISPVLLNEQARPSRE